MFNLIAINYGMFIRAKEFVQYSDDLRRSQRFRERQKLYGEFCMENFAAERSQCICIAHRSRIVPD